MGEWGGWGGAAGSLRDHHTVNRTCPSGVPMASVARSSVPSPFAASTEPTNHQKNGERRPVIYRTVTTNAATRRDNAAAGTAGQYRCSTHSRGASVQPLKPPVTPHPPPSLVSPVSLSLCFPLCPAAHPSLLSVILLSRSFILALLVAPSPPSAPFSSSSAPFT